MEYILDAEKFYDKESSHEYLKDIMELPDYYGMNLDALYDCLSELSECTFYFENVENAGDYFDTIYEVFDEIGNENENITLIKYF